ncbi:hypothetical protein [Gemmatimonas aurantiaca]|uniref:hypothetical protein n=1 Tax=Gemmatimonas aurantiaca TaxID=173480 RepID=UPI0012EABF1B|nr:hypothetical protein [Gemmatimonas aurantiaca]
MGRSQGRFLQRVRGALGMGFTWAFGWAAAGILIGVASIVAPGRMWDAFFRVFDAPLPALAVPGFIGGAIFSVVLSVVARRRAFGQLSLVRFTAWGAVGGVLLFLVPYAMATLGLATPAENGPGFWRLAAVIGIPFTMLSAISACVTLLVARRSSARFAVDDVAGDIVGNAGDDVGVAEVWINNRPTNALRDERVIRALHEAAQRAANGALPHSGRENVLAARHVETAAVRRD